MPEPNQNKPQPLSASPPALPLRRHFERQYASEISRLSQASDAEADAGWPTFNTTGPFYVTTNEQPAISGAHELLLAVEAECLLEIERRGITPAYIKPSLLREIQEEVLEYLQPEDFRILRAESGATGAAWMLDN